MPNQTIKLNMIILMQHDLAHAVGFYKDLGLHLKFHISNKWAEFDIEGVKLGLAYANQELPERRTGIVLEIADLRAFYEEKKDEVSFINEPVEAIHGIIVSFKDPGNNIIDLYQPTPEKVKEAVHKAAQEKSGKCCDHD